MVNPSRNSPKNKEAHVKRPLQIKENTAGEEQEREIRGVLVIYIHIYV